MVDNNNAVLLAQLAQKNGYEFKVENGQLVYGPPLDASNINLTPPKNSEIFIGRLPKDIDGRIIVNKFSECGRIYMFRIMQNFSGLNRGFAFIQYENVQQADNAIRLLNNCEIRPGDRIGVIRSRNNCRLFIGRLDISLTKEQITAYFNNLTAGLINVTVHKDLSSQENDVGYAFLEFETHKDAARARRSLKPCKLKLGNKHFTVDWASTNGPEYYLTQHKGNARHKSFTSRFNSLVINHLGKSENSQQISGEKSIQNRTEDFVLVYTNIRADAPLPELIKLFSINSQVKLLNIRKEGNCVILFYASQEIALAILKTFEEIKEEFSLCFGEPNKICELIWPTNYIDTTQSLTSNAKGNYT